MAFNFNPESSGFNFNPDDVAIEPPKPAGMIRKIADKGLGFASGAVGATKAIADATGAGNRVSGALGTANEFLNDNLSDEAKADQQEQGVLMADARAKGFNLDGFASGAKAFAVAPGQMIAQGMGSIVPILAGTALTGGAAPAAAVGAGIGAAMGMGTAKGAIYDRIKKEGGTEEAAIKAQEYSGANTDQIALGGALGVADALTGVSRIAGGMVRGALGKPVTQAVTTGAERGLIGRMGMGVAGEMPLEAAQGGQEQVAANLAAQRAGYEAGTWDNVASNATLEALASAGPGAVFGALDRKAAPATPPAPTPEQTPPGQTAPPPLQIGNTPDPLISFADGTVARQSEVDTYISGLPAEQQPAMRAKLMGMAPQPTKPEFSDILNTDSVYATWSNVRDGSDRGIMQDEMGYVQKTYGPIATEAKRAEIATDLSQQFKWFRAAKPSEQAAAIDALIASPKPAPQPAKPSKTMGLTPTAAPSLTNAAILAVDSGVSQPAVANVPVEPDADPVKAAQDEYRTQTAAMLEQQDADAYEAYMDAITQASVAQDEAPGETIAAVAPIANVLGDYDNLSDDEFFAQLGATPEETQDAIASQPSSPQASDASPVSSAANVATGTGESAPAVDAKQANLDRIRKANSGDNPSATGLDQPTPVEPSNQPAASAGAAMGAVPAGSGDAGNTGASGATTGASVPVLDGRAGTDAVTPSGTIATPAVLDGVQNQPQAPVEQGQVATDDVATDEELIKQSGLPLEASTLVKNRGGGYSFRSQNKSLFKGIAPFEGGISDTREGALQLAKLKAEKQGFVNPNNTPAASTQSAPMGVTPAPVTGTSATQPAADTNFVSKQIPDMTDEELQLAKAHYPADHKRAPKITKEINRRALVAKLKPVSQPTESTSAKTPEAIKAAPERQEAAAAGVEKAKPTVDEVARAIQLKVAQNRLKHRQKSRKDREAKGYAPNSTAESEQADYEKEISAAPMQMQLDSASRLIGTDPEALINMFVNGSYEASEDVFKEITGVKIRGLNAKDKKAALYQWAKWTPEQIAEAEAREESKRAEKTEGFKQKDLEYDARGAWAGLGKLQVKDKDGKVTTGQEFVLDMVAKGFNQTHTHKKGIATVYSLTDGARSTNLKNKDFNAFVKAAIGMGGLDKALNHVKPDWKPVAIVPVKAPDLASIAQETMRGEAVKPISKEESDRLTAENMAATEKREKETAKAEEKRFYVTMIRGDQVARLAGPFDTKEQAEAMVPSAREEANKADPRSAFDAFGVTGVTENTPKPGVLNKQLGIDADGKPSAITQADVDAATKQAIQQIEQAIDGMKADAVQRVAVRFLPTMGIKTPIGKARIKTALSDPKVNLLAAASEFGVDLPKSIKRALEAKDEGRVEDGESAKAEPTDITHNGTRIYKTTIKVGDEVKPMWAVETQDNKRKGASGERKTGGDSLHDTLEAAKKAADFEAKQDAEKQQRVAEVNAEQAAAQAKKDANKGKSIVERRKDAILDGATKLPAQAGLGVGSKRESMQKAVDQDRAIVEKMVDDTAAKKRDNDEVERGRGGRLPTGNINYPGVKEYFEAVARLKADDYKKPSYRVYAGREADGSFYEITKTEYDYAQELKATPASGDFGPIYQGLSNQPEKAIEKLMAEKQGEVPDAFVHPELGDIAFIYGDETRGLHHIELKRSIDFVRGIPELLRKGRLERDPKGLPRAYVVSDKDPANVAVIRLDWDGKDKVWLVTAYRDDEGKFAGAGKISNTSGLTSEVPANDGVVFSQKPSAQTVPQPATESKPAEQPTQPAAQEPIKEGDRLKHTDGQIYTVVDVYGNTVDAERTIESAGGVTRKAGISLDAIDAMKARAAAQEPAAPDWMAELFSGEPTTPAAQPDMNAPALRDMIKTLVIDLQAQRDDWANRTYKTNANRVNLRGDGPSNQESLSITALNEGRRTKALQAFDDQLKQLDKLDGQLETASGAKTFLDLVKATWNKAQAFKPQSPDQLSGAPLFESLMIDALKLQPAQGSYTSLPITKALRGMMERAQEPAKPAAITDFGEKILGARKDYATLMKDAESVDISAEPLSKSWPEPDYQKLLDAGTPKRVVALVRSMRDEIPTKPQKTWKLQSWAAQVELLRSVTSRILNGDITLEALNAKLSSDEYRSLQEAIGGRADLYDAVGHEKSLKGITFKQHLYSLYKGERNVIKWAIEQQVKATAWSNWPREIAVSNTREQTLKDFIAKYESLDLGKSKAKPGFILYGKRGEKGTWIGKKIGREYVDLKKFDDVKEARAYMASNLADLEKSLERYKDTPYERNEDNAPRVGGDHRNGAPVTPEVFAETFGFRGVQFGNYVEQGRRQSDLNEAFDALMDMAAVLGIPPKAISLDGRLGLAFGARGKGGKNAPAAHYEPGMVVINLTKGGGPGSLAHEWFHAMDNYFAKDGGVTSDGDGSYMTGTARGDALRVEMREAFKAIKRAINAGALKIRSLELDKRRTSAYWSTPIEMAARSFESYIVAKLQDQNASNDYLANIVSEKFWEASDAIRLGPNSEQTAAPSYPYPAADEMPVMRAAFDDFFKTVQTKETDKGVALFSQGLLSPASFGPKPMPDQIQRLVDKVLQVAKNVVPVSVIGNPSQIPGIRVPAGSKPKGALVDGRIYLFADNIESIGDAYVTLFHELFHLGLQKVIPAEDYAVMLRKFSRNLLVQKYVREWKASPEGVEKAATMPSSAYEALAAEEAMAMISEELSANGGIGTRKLPGLVKTMLSWFAGVAEQLGFPAQFGTWIRKLSQNDAEKFVTDMVRAVLGGDKILSKTQAKYGTQAAEMTAQTRLSAGKAANQTDTPAFNAWFGDSKVVGEDGKPLVVYHGTKGDFSTFDPLRIGSASDQGWYGSGFYFTPDPETASDVYAKRTGDGTDGANVMPVYLSIKNPYDWRSENVRGLYQNSAGASLEKRKELEARGFDGVVVYDDYIQLSSDGKLTDKQWAMLPESTTSLLSRAMVEKSLSRREWGYSVISNNYGKEFADSLPKSRRVLLEVVAFNPTQIKSATGNNGNFDPTNPDIRFSQGLGDTLASAANNVRVNKVVDKLNEHFSHEGTLSFWHKTVGSPFDLAQRSVPFKRVFTAVQDFINGVSFYSNEAADLAPKLLPKLENWRDIGKSPISSDDNKAIQAPIFQGTLSWARDESGKLVKIEVLEAAAAQLTPEQKAQRLLRGGHVSEGVLKMWQGLPVDQFEAIINGKYESDMLKAGVVFTDQELKSVFSLTPEQIKLYREFRSATDKSLDNLAKAEMLRFGGKDAIDMRDMVMDAKDADDASVLLRDHFLQAAIDDPGRSDELTATANSMIERGDKARKLKEQGYAPLSRFGQYSVDVVVDGERQYFSLFETKHEANQMAAKMKMMFGADNVKSGTVSQLEFQLLQGITPESLELFGNMLGLDSTGDEASDKAFQTYLKLTKNNRSTMKRMIHRKGIAGFNEDAGRVLAAFVYSNGRQTAGALHMGEITQSVNDIPQGQGQLKDAAVRLRDYVQNPKEEAQAMRGLLFAQYLGGSVASAFVNFTQPFTVSFPYLSQFGGAKRAGAALLQAMKDQKSGNYEPALANALKKADEEGTTQPQAVHELMAQSRGAATLKSGDGTRSGEAMAQAGNALSKLSMGWGKLFGLAEQINRRSTYIAAFRMAVENKVADPAGFAKQAVDETQFINNKGNKSRFARGAVGATLMTFKSYSINYLELLHRMATKNGPEGKKAAALALGMLFLMAGAGGMPGADDLDDVIDFFAQRLGYNFSSSKARQEFLEELFGPAGALFVERGLTGLPGSPIDVSGRMSMGNLIPGTGLLLKKRDHTRDTTEILGAMGDMVQRGFKAGDLALDGNIFQSVMMAAPKAVSNAYKGAQMADSGAYKDDKGYKVQDTTLGEAAFKAIGFQPASVSKVQESNYLTQRAKDFYSLKASDIRARWARGIYEKDQSQVQQARDMMADWNEKNPDQRIQANIPAILKRVNEMRKTKEQRIADTAPKAMKAQLRRDIAERAVQ